MENQNHKTSNFWFGFALGSIAVGGGVYLLGTKQGRKTLKKLLELSENLEENLASVVEELEGQIGEKAEELKDVFRSTNKTSYAKPQLEKNNQPTIGSLLDKIKIIKNA